MICPVSRDDEDDDVKKILKKNNVSLSSANLSILCGLAVRQRIKKQNSINKN